MQAHAYLVGAIGSVLSWGYTVVHYCWYAYRMEAIDEATKRLIAPHLLSSFVLRAVFVFACLVAVDTVWPGFTNEPTAAWIFVISATSVVLFERLFFDHLLGPRFSRHPIGAAMLQVFESLIGLDTDQWSKVAEILDKRLIDVCQNYRDRLGRHSDALFAENKKTVERHLNTQRNWAFLIGGPGFHKMTKQHVRTPDAQLDILLKGKKFDVIAQALGVQRLEDAASHYGAAPHPQRQFERKNCLNEVEATVLIQRPDTEQEPVPVEIVQTSTLGLRVRCPQEVAVVADGTVFDLTVGNQRLQCCKIWGDGARIGVEIVRLDAETEASRDEVWRSVAACVWRQQAEDDSVEFAGGEASAMHLTIRATGGGNGIGSWRTDLLLERGKYVFHGVLTAQDVVVGEPDENRGAGIRISGAHREWGIEGTATHRPVTFAFEVEEELQKVVLVVELRAVRGELRMAKNSLRLSRQ